MNLYLFFSELANFFRPKQVSGVTLAVVPGSGGMAYYVPDCIGLDSSGNPIIQVFNGPAFSARGYDYTLSAQTITYTGATPPSGPITVFYTKA